MVNLALRKPEREEYMAVMCGSTALTTVAGIVMGAAFDELEGTDYPRDKKIWHEMKVAEWDMDDVRKAMTAVVATQGDYAWTQDFGMAVYGRVGDHVERLRYAIANALGRCKGVERPSAVALLVVAQHLAHEAAEYTGGKAGLFVGCKVRNRKGTMISVKNLLRSMTCVKAERAMAEMARLILEPVMPEGADYLGDTSIGTGIEAIERTLLDQRTWEYAMERANELNSN